MQEAIAIYVFAHICVNLSLQMEFEFAIPLNRSDLLSKTSINQYVVEEVYPLRILASKLQGTLTCILYCIMHCIILF